MPPPAPDLPPLITHARIERSISVSLTPAQADPAELRGAVVVMVDALRASATIAAALHAGAARIIPVLTVDEALTRARSADASRRPCIGGERAGQHIPGFDFGNSPRDYTAERIAGRDILFTTTNGTAALHFAHQCGAAEILVGSFVNLTAICDHLLNDHRFVHILCAGTRDNVTLDDCLAAGAMVERLLAEGSGRNLSAGDGGDPARLTLAAWHLAEQGDEGESGGEEGGGGGLEAAMLASRGGRNLTAIGLARDVLDCCQIDAHPVIPRFDPATGAITAI